MRSPSRILRKALVAGLLTLALSASANLVTTASAVTGAAVTSPSAEWQATGPLDSWTHNPAGGFSCAGTLVAPTWVLTAASCAGPIGWFHAGATNVEDSTNLITSSKSVVYPGFTAGTDNDLMLVQLNAAPAGITPIALGTSADEPTAGSDADIAGWGRNASSTPYGGVGAKFWDDDLHVATATRSDDTDCAAIAGVSTALSLCAGKSTTLNTSDSCKGDRGGPLVSETADGPVLVGIQSVPAPGCDAHSYLNVYTRISAYRDWIEQTTGLSVPAPPETSKAQSVVAAKSSAKPYKNLQIKLISSHTNGPYVIAKVDLTYAAGKDSAGVLGCGDEAKLSTATRSGWRSRATTKPHLSGASCKAKFATSLSKSLKGSKLNFQAKVSALSGGAPATAAKKLRIP
jgi:secreted trypsin-like serine protease